MYYCFPIELKKLIPESKLEGFLFFDEEHNCFFDCNHRKVNIKGKKILIISDIFRLYEMFDLIEDFEGISINTIEDIENVKHWANFIEPHHRDVSIITGQDFEDLAFLTCLFEQYGVNGSIFLKTVEKDFHGIITIIDIVEPDSPFRKAMKYHLQDEFMISPVITIDEDNLGKQEYRAFIHNRVITSISRPLHKTYHRIPKEVIQFINTIIKELPNDFPDYFVLDVASSKGKLDILEFNAIETAVPYLYNSRMAENPSDLTHQDIIALPKYKTEECSFSGEEPPVSPLFDDIPGSFAHDFHQALTGENKMHPAFSALFGHQFIKY
ncbi:MAG: hypothetical protein HFH08_00130 [Bacilli bacterium]|nr:hypothetical protein [Bacilli bacterium]